jgi:hypothetical protein
VKQIPDKIYLQVHGADKDDLTAAELKEFAPNGDVAWCEDKIFDTDIEYVRKRGEGLNGKV